MGAARKQTPAKAAAELDKGLKLHTRGPSLGAALRRYLKT